MAAQEGSESQPGGRAGASQAMSPAAVRVRPLGIDPRRPAPLEPVHLELVEQPHFGRHLALVYAVLEQLQRASLAAETVLLDAPPPATPGVLLLSQVEDLLIEGRPPLARRAIESDRPQPPVAFTAGASALLGAARCFRMSPSRWRWGDWARARRATAACARGETKR